MNPEDVAKFDQAGAGFRECAAILAGMARELLPLGLAPNDAAAIALELMQTVLLHAESAAASQEAREPDA